MRSYVLYCSAETKSDRPPSRSLVEEKSTKKKLMTQELRFSQLLLRRVLSSGL
jgi:hypothetical protein